MAVSTGSTSSFDLYSGWTPRETQAKFLADRHRFCAIIGNRGSMKTTSAIWRTMQLSATIPHNIGLIGRWKKTDLYTTTIRGWMECYPRDVYGHIWEFFGGIQEPEGIRVRNARSGSYEDGTTIFLASLQLMDKYRGGNFGFFFVDQLEECHPLVWGDLVKVLRLACVPLAQRFGYVTVNKRKEYWWIRRLFIEKKALLKNADMSRYHYFTPRWDENVEYVRDGYYRDIEASARTESEIAFEVYGEDPECFGAVFPDFSDPAHLRAFEFKDLGENLAYYLGYDEGYDVPSAFLFCGVTRDGTHWFRAEHYRARMGLAAHKEAITRLAERIGFPLDRRTNYIADCAIFGKMDGNGVSIADQWGSDWPWRGASKDRVSGWERIRALQELGSNGKPRFFVHPTDCPNFVEEIREAVYDANRPGKGAWEKRCEDHAADSARFICQASQEPAVFNPPLRVPGSFRDLQEARKRGRGWVAPGLAFRPTLLPREPGEAEALRRREFQ